MNRSSTGSFIDYEANAPEKYRGLFGTNKFRNFWLMRELGLCTKPIMNFCGSDLIMMQSELEHFCIAHYPVVVRAIPYNGHGRKFILNASYREAYDFIDSLNTKSNYRILIEPNQEAEFSGNIKIHEDGTGIVESTRGSHTIVAYPTDCLRLTPREVFTPKNKNANTVFLSDIDHKGIVWHPDELNEAERIIIRDLLRKIKLEVTDDSPRYMPGYYEWIYDTRYGSQFIDAIMRGLCGQGYIKRIKPLTEDNPIVA